MNTSRLRRTVTVSAMLALALSTLTVSATGAQSEGDPTKVSLWTASAGAPDVVAPIKKWIEDFNASQTSYEVELTAFPDANYAYTDTIVAAALSDSLPCILDVDGPNIPSWAYAGYLQPLALPESTVNADFLPAMYGMWQDQLYGIGRGEDAIGLFARKSDLDEFGIRVPTLEQPWTSEEFQQSWTHTRIAASSSTPSTPAWRGLASGTRTHSRRSSRVWG